MDERDVPATGRPGGRRVTQGQFSFLPELSDEQIERQVAYALRNGWAIGLEHTDDPHPRNTYWEMYGPPKFDIRDAARVMVDLEECRRTFPGRYIRVTAFDSTRGWETPRMSFVVARPSTEPGFRLERREGHGRQIGYTIHSYATDRPEGDRYGAGADGE